MTTTAPGWQFDRAASGNRLRLFTEDRHELIAYEAGDWEVRGGPLGIALAGGVEPTWEKAQARAIAVHRAMTEPMVEEQRP